MPVISFYFPKYLVLFIQVRETFVLFSFASLSRIENIYIISRRDKEQTNSGGSRQQRSSLFTKHTEYRLQAKEYKKKRYTLFKTAIKTIRKKQPRVNWSASSGEIFTRSGI